MGEKYRSNRIKDGLNSIKERFNLTSMWLTCSKSSFMWCYWSFRGLCLCSRSWGWIIRAWDRSVTFALWTSEFQVNQLGTHLLTIPTAMQNLWSYGSRADFCAYRWSPSHFFIIIKKKAFPEHIHHHYPRIRYFQPRMPLLLELLLELPACCSAAAELEVQASKPT